ncbi:hypothetical protein AOLI_G00033670 [Acnodon oligacanthus]
MYVCRDYQPVLEQEAGRSHSQSSSERGSVSVQRAGKRVGKEMPLTASSKCAMMSVKSQTYRWSAPAPSALAEGRFVRWSATLCGMCPCVYILRLDKQALLYFHQSEGPV